MANSFITNLYPKPTSDKPLRKMTVNSTSDSHSLINAGDDTSGTKIPDGSDAGAFDKLTKYVVIDVQGADAFVTYSGTKPNATYQGHRLYAGRSYTWSEASASKALFIKAGTVDSIIYASEFTN